MKLLLRRCFVLAFLHILLLLLYGVCLTVMLAQGASNYAHFHWANLLAQHNTQMKKDDEAKFEAEMQSFEV